MKIKTVLPDQCALSTTTETNLIK
ncbi:hypothetical protein CCACVL1_03730, partial [Corchorus capsularis]